jgi:hypothetical protein
MRKIFTLLLLVAGFAASAQQFNNEWIKFGQTYYKIKIAKADGGIFRIPKSLLDAFGIGNAQVQNFELWRNGEKVPFYSSVSSGALPGNGYLEFWGEPNDGKPDNPLYRNPVFQHTTHYSLQTDTAVYFLSVNTSGAGTRYTNVANNVAGNSLPAEQYFMYTTGVYFTMGVTNPGFASLVGQYVYSSSYDQGEVYGSGDIYNSTPYSWPVTIQNVSAAGPSTCTLKFGAMGNAINTRNIKVQVNGVVVKDTVMDYFNDLVTTAPVDKSTINSGAVTFQFTNTSANSTDRMQVSFFELTYPHTFDFSGQKNFKFGLPANSNGYYLQITNFNYGSTVPVLYDITNGERYEGDLSTPGMIKFALPGTATDRQLVLVSEEAGNITTVSEMTTRNFTDYSLTGNQGNYLIISNPILYNGSNGNNPVDDYKNYRASTAGGGFKPIIADINELVDQFAFGIKKHPLSVRNFLRFARAKFTQPIKCAFLMGRGVNYTDYQRTARVVSTSLVADQLNLVPTFGWPGSDNLLSAEDLTVPVAATPIGRLSVVSGKEIEDYLEKVKEYEQVQLTASNTIAGRGWMKNIVHVTGSSDLYLGTVLCNYMEIYQQIIEDTLFGGRVHMFCKTSTNPVEQVSPDKIAGLFAEGISVLTYFGHSSATTLEFNIDNPENYNNPGKYPVFFVNGCKAGDFFTYNPSRLLVNETLSERFTLAKQRGGIGFVASTHFGIVNYLNLYLTGLYGFITQHDYDKPLGETVRDALKEMVRATGGYDYYARTHAEEITLHGDPAIRINAQPKPDYAIEDQLIKITPPFISLAEKEYEVKIKAVNLGRAPADSIVFEVKQQYPNGTTAILYRQKISGIRDADSVVLTVPLVATRDKGQNRIIATIDADNTTNEISESNNSASKDFYIYEDEARPVFPYNYAITNNPTEQLVASTANPVSSSKTWLMEIDTSGAFNSSMKVQKSVTSGGGVLTFDPGLHYLDSTVYYWRVAPNMPNPNDIRWNTASFIYINGSVDGFSQSQYHQHKESELIRISLDSTDHLYKFGTRENFLTIKNGIFPSAANQATDISVTVNNSDKIQSVCGVSGLIFYVFDSVTMQPWYNADAGLPGRFGSDAVCGPNRRWQFQFNMTAADTAVRRRIVNFMDMIPGGTYVVVNNIWHTTLPNLFPKDWILDTSYLGTNNSIYHRLLEQGFVKIDSVNTLRAFSFIYRKDRQGFFTPKAALSNGMLDRLTFSTTVTTPDTIGFINSPKFGPARAWKKVQWNGTSLENPTHDYPTVDVVGSNYNGVETVLYTLDKNNIDFDISTVSASQYPYIQLKMRNVDTFNVTPFQLKYWRVLYEPVPEGSLAANLYYTAKDTVGLGEKVPIGIAFKNVSKLNFDSMLVKVYLIDKNNVTHTVLATKYKPIVVGDTILINAIIDTKDYPGNNIVQVEVNPEYNQPEYYHFNNVLFHDLYVVPDATRPLLDVTFDGVHILNNDIVSARPHIQIKIKDESKYLLLSDTSISSVQIRYPDGTARTYHFDNDTLRFIPATSTSDNTATIEFTPQFTKQIDPGGDAYELIVTGKDQSGNKASDIAYRIGFKVITKPMISNLLNYPNPFSTSTAFVFTITGSDIPQNIRIQILTVTGKIVREITMNELGPLHIGRNITEGKWDGTDQYGQKLGNGVYLYRVITSLNGRPMDKYKATGVDTDKYFNNGYGKMYLMR